jgi:hypothetical protein
MVMKNSILWDVTFKAESCLLHASNWLVTWFIFDPEDGGKMFSETSVDLQRNKLNSEDRTLQIYLVFIFSPINETY